MNKQTILQPFIETPFRHTKVVSEENALQAMDKFAKDQSLNFVDWLMDNCELSGDNSLWSYEGEDYTNDALYKIFKSENK